MKTRTILSFMLLISLSASKAIAQTQTIRGTVIDAQANYPLIGANVILLDTDPIRGVSTDIDGKFVLEDVPIGRQALSIQFISYKSQNIPNVLVTTGKEVILEIKLEESVKQLKEVVISANGKKELPNNEMAKVSAR
ncbi:MAG: carboxypeptidase-like regulatory domain-containing protein, partial [Flavobacteriales bacterium]|nr:carboxypeptidase-like regulatory domain-containing protein [Flavobacteriales bacterium]